MKNIKLGRIEKKIKNKLRKWLMTNIYEEWR